MGITYVYKLGNVILFATIYIHIFYKCVYHT